MGLDAIRKNVIKLSRHTTHKNVNGKFLEKTVLDLFSLACKVKFFFTKNEKLF